MTIETTPRYRPNRNRPAENYLHLMKIAKHNKECLQIFHTLKCSQCKEEITNEHYASIKWGKLFCWKCILNPEEVNK